MSVTRDFRRRAVTAPCRAEAKPGNDVLIASALRLETRRGAARGKAADYGVPGSPWLLGDRPGATLKRPGTPHLRTCCSGLLRSSACS
jgi:hypothetical protein